MFSIHICEGEPKENEFRKLLEQVDYIQLILKKPYNEHTGIVNNGDNLQNIV